ncbi:MAG: phosphatidate cytidylyltransferase [Actinomycetia bacterium]|jgi:phosphatidate cytidylyltransferase|nr:phosphatidate cytidylyltransferase [Actinomycetes bacterium]
MPRRERGARAGRNLPLAIGTALALAGVLIGSLLVSRPAFVAFLLGIVTLALLELLTVLRARATRPAGPVVLAVGAVLVVGAYLEGPAALSFGLLAATLGAFAWYLVDRGRTEVTRNVAATIFAVVYVPFMAAHLSLVVGRADHYVGALIGYAALVVIYDTAAYATGATLGRRPIAPQVSPNKSWEGAIGASIACLAAGALLLPLWEPWTLASGLVLAGATCVVAPLGDLSESMLKRDLAVKDMGSILPGHGGMLDRVDALLFMAPVLYYVLAGFNLVHAP